MNENSTRARMNVHPVMTSYTTPTRRPLIGQTYDIQRPLVTAVFERHDVSRRAGCFVNVRSHRQIISVFSLLLCKYATCVL